MKTKKILVLALLIFSLVMMAACSSQSNYSTTSNYCAMGFARNQLINHNEGNKFSDVSTPFFSAIAKSGFSSIPISSNAQTMKDSTKESTTDSGSSIKSDASKKTSTSSDNSGTKKDDETFSFSMDADCAECHVDQQSSYSDNEKLGSLHDSITCISCHDDKKGLEKAHGKVKYGKKPSKTMKRTSVSSDICLKCHNNSNRIEKSAKSTVLTDSEGNVANPHELVENEQHDTITCASCHKMHSNKPLEKTSKAKCVSCHHADVYECYTCHE